MKFKIIFIFTVTLFLYQSLSADSFQSNDLLNKNYPANSDNFQRIEFSQHKESFSYSSLEMGCGEAFHQDTIHRFDFRYNDRKRGIKPYIAPALLITTGTILHFSTGAKENFQDWVQENFAYTGHIDDYIQYAPGVAVYALNAFGVKGKNNFGNRTAIVVKSLLINDLMVSSLKKWVDSDRPNGDPHSFPSGHTSTAFALAHFMHKEYGDRSIWYSIGAYSCATAVGVMRVAKNAHWISDVVAGAGFGMLSTELVYLTHLYKWDNEHIKNLDIFPWSSRQQKGIALVYRF